MSSLSNRVAQLLQSKIKHAEYHAGVHDQLVDCHHYLTLAQLYQNQQNFDKALVVVNRFLNLGRANPGDESIMSSKKQELVLAMHEQRQQQSIEQNIELLAPNFSLVAMTDEEIEINQQVATHSFMPFKNPSSSIVSAQNKTEEQELPFDIVKLVAICAGYTGKTLTDEIYELSLVAFNYCRNNDRIIGIVGQYHGSRTPQKELPESSKLRSAMPKLTGKQTLDEPAIIELMQDAVGVISHNDPYIERQHFLSLYPKFSRLKWWSSQQDIPWHALGFKDRALSELLAFYNITNVPRTPFERARGIIRLLSQREPNTVHTYLRRLLSCKPMRAIEWTSELKAHSAKVQGKLFAFLYAS